MSSGIGEMEIAMNKVSSIFVVLAISCVTGCATTRGTARASMSLEQAICEIQNAIVKTRRPASTRAGVTPSEASVTLALGVKDVKAGEVSGKLKLGIVEWGPKGSWSRENTALSTLQIKFVPGDTHFTVHSIDGVDYIKLDGKTESIELPDCSTLE